MSNLVPMPQGQNGQIQQSGVSGNLQIQTVDDLSRVSMMMAKSGFFSDCREAAQAGVKIMAGVEMGFPAFAAMSGIHIISGKASVGGNLMAAKIKSSNKYNYKIIELDAQTCRLRFFEAGEVAGPDIVITMAMAREKKWNMEWDKEKKEFREKHNWKTYPDDMLFNRAISRGFRRYCPDLFLGAPAYTPDELGAETDEDGNIVRMIDPTPSHAFDDRPAQPAPVEVVEPYITPAQVKRFHAVKTKHGWTDTQAKALLSDLGIQSSKEIPAASYDAILSRLEKGPAVEPEVFDSNVYEYPDVEEGDR